MVIPIIMIFNCQTPRNIALRSIRLNVCRVVFALAVIGMLFTFAMGSDEIGPHPVVTDFISKRNDNVIDVEATLANTNLVVGEPIHLKCEFRIAGFIPSDQNCTLRFGKVDGDLWFSAEVENEQGIRRKLPFPVLVRNSKYPKQQSYEFGFFNKTTLSCIQEKYFPQPDWMAAPGIYKVRINIRVPYFVGDRAEPNPKAEGVVLLEQETVFDVTVSPDNNNRLTSIAQALAEEAMTSKPLTQWPTASAFAVEGLFALPEEATGRMRDNVTSQLSAVDQHAQQALQTQIRLHPTPLVLSALEHTAWDKTASDVERNVAQKYLVSIYQEGSEENRARIRKAFVKNGEPTPHEAINFIK